MAVSEAELRAKKKYNAKFARVEVRIPLEKKSELDNHLAMMNESINHFLQRAIEETLERDKANNG